ncbi:MAG TPA: PorP/SprF family type IX secretion system membrane protein, partial [Cytophagaceae bacterium]
MIFDNLKYLLFFSLITLLVSVDKVFSQDIQFSQFYNVPLYQNPAFAGSSHESRATVHQRIQWPRLDAKYITSVASFDKYFANAKSGVGLMAIQDFQGSNTISSTEISAMYAYELHITPTLTLRSGLQGSYVTRYLNYANLMYPREFNDVTGYTKDPSTDFGGQRIHYVDLATGGIFYSKNLWIGLSGHHLNLPNQSFDKGVARLPGKFAVTGGYKIHLANNRRTAYS